MSWIRLRALDVEALVTAHQRLAEPLPRQKPGVLRRPTLRHRDPDGVGEERFDLPHFLRRRLPREGELVALGDSTDISAGRFGEEASGKVHRLFADERVVEQ